MNETASLPAAAGPCVPSLPQAIASVDHPAVLTHLARLEIRRHLALVTANDLLFDRSISLTERERSDLARIIKGDAQDHGTMRFCAIDLGWRRALADWHLLSSPSPSSTSLSLISLTLERYFMAPFHPHSLIGDPLAPGLDILLRFGRIYHQIAQERENERGTPLGERESKASKIDGRVLRKMTGDWARCAERIARRVEGIRAKYPENHSPPAHASHSQNSNSQDSLPTPSPSSEDQPLVHRTSQRRRAVEPEAPRKRSREEEEEEEEAVEVESGEWSERKVVAAVKKARTSQDGEAQFRPEQPRGQEQGKPTEDAPMEVDGAEGAKPASLPCPAPNASFPLTQAPAAPAPPQSDAPVAPVPPTRMPTTSTTAATLAIPASGSTSTSTSVSSCTRSRSRSPLSPAPPSATPLPTSALPTLALSQLPALLPLSVISRPLTTTAISADSQPAPIVTANNSKDTSFILGRLRQGSNANQKKLSDRRMSATAQGGAGAGGGWPTMPVPELAESKSVANEQNDDDASSSGRSSKATAALEATASEILMPPPPAKPRSSQSPSQSQSREDPAPLPTPRSPPQPAISSTSQFTAGPSSSQCLSSSVRLEPSTQLSSPELPPAVAQPHAQDARDGHEPASTPLSALGPRWDEKEKLPPRSSQFSEHSESGKPKILVPDTSASTCASSGSFPSTHQSSSLISDSQSSSQSDSASTSRSTKAVPSPSSDAASLDFRLPFSSSQPITTTPQAVAHPQMVATQPPAALEVGASSVTGDFSVAASSQSRSQPLSQPQHPQTQVLFVSTTATEGVPAQQQDEPQSQPQSHETAESNLSYLSHGEVARREAAVQAQPQPCAADPDERARPPADEGVLEEELGEAEPLSQAPEPEDNEVDELEGLDEFGSDDEESQQRRIGRRQSFENLHAAASSSQEDDDDDDDVFDERFLTGDVEYEGMTLSRYV
ncbi:hypothetical protein JCM21900_004666 [Sporobolomyces salmonicolor]